MVVPLNQNRSVDLLFRMLPNKRQLPPLMLINDTTTTGKNPKKSYGDHRTSVWLQQKYKKGNSVRANGARWRKLSATMGPARRKSSHHVPPPLAKEYPRWKALPHRSCMVPDPDWCILPNSCVFQAAIAPTGIQMVLHIVEAIPRNN